MFTFYILNDNDSSSIRIEDISKSRAWNFNIVFYSIYCTIPIIISDSLAEFTESRQFINLNLVYGISYVRMFYILRPYFAFTETLRIVSLF